MELRVIKALAEQVVALMVESGKIEIASKEDHDNHVEAVVLAAIERSK